MVQRGYSIAIEDQKILPHWKESSIYSSILACDFGIGHVKEGSYEMTGALSQRLTMLSLGSIDLLMECSKDHFEYEVLDGKVEDERYRVVDGVIYYQARIFLTRNSKLKKNSLHATHDSFLSSHQGLMETY